MKQFIYTLIIFFLFLQVKSQTPGSQTSTPHQTSGPYNHHFVPLWTNLNYQSLSAVDNDYASINKFSGTFTNYVVLSQFGFSIPSNATITSLTLTMSEFATGNIVKDYEVYFASGCCNISSNLSNPNPWPTSERAVQYTQAVNLTPAAINDASADFRTYFNLQKNTGKTANIYLNQVTVRVDYTTPIIQIATVNKTQALITIGKRPIEIRALSNQVIVTTPASGKYSLLITDIQGLPLEQKIFYATENSPTVVTLKNKLNGVYLITCTGNGTTKTIKSFLQ